MYRISCDARDRNENVFRNLTHTLQYIPTNLLYVIIHPFRFKSGKRSCGTYVKPVYNNITLCACICVSVG